MTVRTLAAVALVYLIGLSGLNHAAQAEADFPRYKPASRAPEPVDIRTNRYGASRSAPDALAIGDQVEDFSAPAVGGGRVSLQQLRKQGDVVLIFYRGHW